MFDDLLNKLKNLTSTGGSSGTSKPAFFEKFQELTSSVKTKLEGQAKSGDSGEEKKGSVEKSDAEKKRSMMIKVVATVGIVYLAYDHFTTVEEPQEQQRQKPQVKREKNINPLPENQTEEAPPQPTPAEIVEAQPKAKDIPDPFANENREDPHSPPPIPESTAAVSEQPAVSAELPVPTPTAEAQTEVETSLNQGTLTPPPQEILQEEAITEIVQQVSTEQPTSPPPKASSLPAPNYERIGRGLVYNCVGRHWACIDRENYFKCVRSHKNATDNNLQIDCYPSDVYASDEDCKTMQIHNVNTITTTPFCKR